MEEPNLGTWTDQTDPVGSFWDTSQCRLHEADWAPKIHPFDLGQNIQVFRMT